MADILVSFHGRRSGLDALGRFIVDGNPITSAFDANAAYEIGPSQRFTSLTAALDWANATSATRNGDVTITLPNGITSLTTPLHYTGRGGGRVRFEGQTLARSLSAITAVSGSAGGWSVTATLDSGSDVAVGDYVLVKNVTPGIGAPGGLSGRAPFGELRLGFFAQSSSLVTTSGTTVTLSDSVSAVASATLAVGDLVIIKGEIRTVATVSNGATFTVDVAFSRDVTSGVQYWYHCRAATGTATVSSTTVTGTGTAFLTQVNVGDLLLFAGYGVRRVTAIASDTSLTLDGTLTIGSGVAFGVVTGGEQHEGCWAVTAVNGTSVTWTNTMRTAQSKPPLNNVTAGDVTVLKSVLKTASAISGWVVGEASTLYLDKVAVVGAGGSTTVGIDLRGYSGTGVANAVLGDEVGVSGFGYGARLVGPSYLYASGAVFSGHTVRGLDITDGARSYLANATISGNVGNGIFIGPGGYARLSNARSLGNSADGLRMEVGGAIWADFAYFCANGSRGVHVVGGTNTHVVGSRINKNSDGGLYGENGLTGRGTGVMCLSNVSTGITAINGDFEAGQCWSSGNSTGVVVQRSLLTVLNGGVTWNDAYQIYANTIGQAHCDGAVLVGGTYGIYALTGASVYGDNVAIGSNSTENVSCLSGASVDVPGAVGLTTSSAVPVLASSTWAVNDFSSTAEQLIQISGVTGISALGYAVAGTLKIVQFTGAVPLTHNATSLILPGSVDITAAANDTAVFASLGGANWVCVSYQRAARGVVPYSRILNAQAKIGATAGWVLGGGSVDTGLMATLPASQTGSTLVVPLSGVRPGDTLTGFFLSGGIRSSGNTASIQVNLRKYTGGATPTEASIAQLSSTLSVTADTTLNASTAGRSPLAVTITENTSYYFRITATTAVSTEIDLMGVGATASW